MFIYKGGLYIFGGFSSIEGFSSKMFKIDLEEDQESREMKEIRFIED